MTGTSLIAAGAAAYLLSDRQDAVRANVPDMPGGQIPFRPGEREILYLASLAPSGHNTQPWKVRYLEPYRWVVGNDRARWLPAVDPQQRETVLSIGAFLQNLEYAAASLGFEAGFTLLADSNQAEDLVAVTLRQTGRAPAFDAQTIRRRRTLRSGYLNDPIRPADLEFLTGGDGAFFHFFSNGSREFQWLNEQTIEANRRQAYRDDAQSELAGWMRFRSRDALKHLDGLTVAGMEIGGFAGWVVRNFYTRADVMGPGFREQGLDQVRSQVSRSGGWLLLGSRDQSVAELLECGRRLQRLLLRMREKGIAVHPMTQILEEVPHREALGAATGLPMPVQFILRTGYVRNYPDPVSLRRPVERFVGV